MFIIKDHSLTEKILIKESVTLSKEKIIVLLTPGLCKPYLKKY